MDHPTTFQPPGAIPETVSQKPNLAGKIELPTLLILEDDDMPGLMKVQLTKESPITEIDPIVVFDALNHIADEFVEEKDGKRLISGEGFENAVRGFVANLLNEPKCSTMAAMRFYAGVAEYASLLKKSESVWLSSHFTTSSIPGSSPSVSDKVSG